MCFIVLLTCNVEYRITTRHFMLRIGCVKTVSSLKPSRKMGLEWIKATNWFVFSPRGKVFDYYLFTCSVVWLLILFPIFDQGSSKVFKDITNFWAGFLCAIMIVHPLARRSTVGVMRRFRLTLFWYISIYFLCRLTLSHRLGPYQRLFMCGNVHALALLTTWNWKRPNFLCVGGVICWVSEFGIIILFLV